MTARRIVTGGLLLFVAATVGVLVVQGAGGLRPSARDPATGAAATQAPAASPDKPVAPAPPRQVVAYYFHGQKRCNTCRAIQEQSREALESAFPEALMSGLLEWHEVDTEEPGNAHFVTDYGLVGSSLVLVELREGRQARFKNLLKVWDLAADRPAFLAYVQAEARPWLEAP